MHNVDSIKGNEFFPVSNGTDSTNVKKKTQPFIPLVDQNGKEPKEPETYVEVSFLGPDGKNTFKNYAEVVKKFYGDDIDLIKVIHEIKKYNGIDLNSNERPETLRLPKKIMGYELLSNDKNKAPKLNLEI